MGKKELAGSKIIIERFRLISKELDTVIRVLNKLRRRYVYYKVVFKGTILDNRHEYVKC